MRKSSPIKKGAPVPAASDGLDPQWSVLPVLNADGTGKGVRKRQEGASLSAGWIQIDFRFK